MFSFGVAHPGPFFRLLSRFQKVNKLGAFYGQKKKFFYSNMDAFTALSILDTACDPSSITWFNINKENQAWM